MPMRPPGGADLSGLDNIDNAAVVLGGLIGIGGLVVGGGMMDGVVNRGVMDSVVSHNGGGVRGVMGNTVTGASEVGEGGEGNISLGGGKSQGEEGQAESLHGVDDVS